MSEAFVNQVTLDCLLNKHQYEKYISKKVSKEVDKKDKIFYKKRIIGLTKDLLSTEEEIPGLLPDVKYSFDNFIKACVHSFKVMDNNDIIQSEYENIKKIEENELCEANKTKDADNVNADTANDDKTNDSANAENIDETENNVHKTADSILVRSNIRIINTSLDSFIKVKMPQMNDDIILPKQKEINLNNPSLKNKGLK
jgi:hypothetical protein